MVIRIALGVLEEDLSELRIGAEVVSGEASSNDVSLVNLSSEIPDVVLQEVVAIAVKQRAGAGGSASRQTAQQCRVLPGYSCRTARSIRIATASRVLFPE